MKRRNMQGLLHFIFIIVLIFYNIIEDVRLSSLSDNFRIDIYRSLVHFLFQKFK